MNKTVTRTPRRLLALITLLALLAMPLQAFAAKGTALAGEAVTLTPLAGTGGMIGFQARFENSGKSNISGLRFEGIISGGATFNDASDDRCVAANDGAGVACALGSLAAGAPAVELLLVFNAPSSPTPITFSGGFVAEAKNGTPGAKQDTWPIPDQQVEVKDSGDPDFYSALLVEGGAHQSPIVGQDQQSQLLDIPAQGNAYGVSLWQNDNPVPCGALNYFGQTVDVNVANGASPVTVVITFGAIPGLTPAKARILHDCQPVPTDCVASPGYCMTAEYVGSGLNRRVQVTIQLPQNGSIKGFS